MLTGCALSPFIRVELAVINYNQAEAGAGWGRKDMIS